jgi:undecaprenyl diphosphate synthase
MGMISSIVKKLTGDEKRGSLAEIDLKSLPSHIAIIMDGNGRWAKARMLPRIMGHKQGMETLKDIIRYSSDIGINHLTFYAFSTENWKRPAEEVSGLMEILVTYLRSEIDELNRKNVRMDFIGFIDELPQLQRDEIQRAMDITRENDGLCVHFAINYGSRDEILSAVKAVAQDVKDGRIDVSEIDKGYFESKLFTSGTPDPDLMIRTSGEKRLSNYLLWQLSYAEFYFTDVHWPEFTRDELNLAVATYQMRNRRFGGL